MTGEPLPTTWLPAVALPLFVAAMGHAGYELLESAGMAGYTATAAVIALLIIGVTTGMAQGIYESDAGFDILLAPILFGSLILVPAGLLYGLIRWFSS